MYTLSEEIRFTLPKLIANAVIALFFWVMSYISLITLNSINPEIAFLSEIGLLLGAGIFLLRTLLDALPVITNVTGLFLRRLGIKKGWSWQRISKDSIYLVVIILVAAAIFPLFSNLLNFGALLQEITTYAALGLILLFVYDIGRTFYKITEKKANSVANRFSASNNEENINGN